MPGKAVSYTQKLFLRVSSRYCQDTINKDDSRASDSRASSSGSSKDSRNENSSNSNGGPELGPIALSFGGSNGSQDAGRH